MVAPGPFILTSIAALITAGGGGLRRELVRDSNLVPRPPLSSMRNSEQPRISWDDVQHKYETVREYVAIYEKEERAISHGETQKIRLLFRKPFAVRMEWLDERGGVDQIAVYRRGENDGKVLARRRGALGSLAGTLRLNPTDKLALQDSRHPITEVGIGSIVERTQRDLRNPAVTSRFGEREALDGRDAYRLELTSAAAAVEGLPGARRALVWVDAELILPVKVELYDAAQSLLERHRFKDVQLNPGLSDQVFTLEGASAAGRGTSTSPVRRKST